MLSESRQPRKLELFTVQDLTCELAACAFLNQLVETASKNLSVRCMGLVGHCLYPLLTKFCPSAMLKLLNKMSCAECQSCLPLQKEQTAQARFRGAILRFDSLPALRFSQKAFFLPHFLWDYRFMIGGCCRPRNVLRQSQRRRQDRSSRYYFRNSLIIA